MQAKTAHQPRIISSPGEIRTLVNSEKILKTLWSLRELSESSQRTYARKIKLLAKHVNLDDSIKTEKYILSLDKASKYKLTLLSAYMHYTRANNIDWKCPRIKASSAPITVPTEERIDKVISAASQKWVTIFNISKHGLRPDEVHKITLRDLDLERGLLTVRTSKLGACRTLKLKEAAVFNLSTYVHRHQIINLNQKFFPKAPAMRDMWNRCRKRAYLNFRDPELLKIRLYDLRHWYGTTEYMKSRDIFHVKYLMGHRDIKSTLVYMHVAQGLVNNSEEYTCRVAHNLDEATKLIESGFEYVTEMESMKIFRKRK
jgi:integrase